MSPALVNPNNGHNMTNKTQKLTIKNGKTTTNFRVKTANIRLVQYKDSYDNGRHPYPTLFVTLSPGQMAKLDKAAPLMATGWGTFEEAKLAMIEIDGKPVNSIYANVRGWGPAEVIIHSSDVYFHNDGQLAYINPMTDDEIDSWVDHFNTWKIGKDGGVDVYWAEMIKDGISVPHPMEAILKEEEAKRAARKERAMEILKAQEKEEKTYYYKGNIFYLSGITTNVGGRCKEIYHIFGPQGRDAMSHPHGAPTSIRACKEIINDNKQRDSWRRAHAQAILKEEEAQAILKEEEEKSAARKERERRMASDDQTKFCLFPGLGYRCDENSNCRNCNSEPHPHSIEMAQSIEDEMAYSEPDWHRVERADVAEFDATEPENLNQKECVEWPQPPCDEPLPF